MSWPTNSINLEVNSCKVWITDINYIAYGIPNQFSYYVKSKGQSQKQFPSICQNLFIKLIRSIILTSPLKLLMPHEFGFSMKYAALTSNSSIQSFSHSLSLYIYLFLTYSFYLFSHPFYLFIVSLSCLPGGRHRWY